jgi:hypothetical protein
MALSVVAGVQLFYEILEQTCQSVLELIGESHGD